MKVRLLLAAVLSCMIWFCRAETYVVCVGIANYQNISSLLLPEKDAKCIANMYKTHTNNVILITGKYATHDTIIKALKDQFKRAKKGDYVVFYFSGHGYVGGFCPYDMAEGYKNGLTFKEVYAIFRESRASHKIIFADACYSGSLRRGNRSTKPETASDVLLFLSSRSNESSIETPKLKNGFFTAYLERGLRGGADKNKDKKITANEIFNFVSNGVKKVSNDRQHPVMWGKFNDNFVLLDWR
ncbi:caspase family protein [bacterium]|nr:caspase family protein [bacterium]